MKRFHMAGHLRHAELRCPLGWGGGTLWELIHLTDRASSRRRP